MVLLNTEPIGGNSGARRSPAGQKKIIKRRELERSKSNDATDEDKRNDNSDQRRVRRTHQTRRERAGETEMRTGNPVMMQLFMKRRIGGKDDRDQK